MSNVPPASDAAQSLAEAPIEQRADFGFVRYATCWEDADVLVQALGPGHGKRFLSIASAGDNALALLATGAEVVAADLSGAQLACLELRSAAFRRLDYFDLLAFSGVAPSECRPETYRLLENDLPQAPRAFWNSRPADICLGIIHAGKFERNFRVFRTRILPLIHSQRTIARLFEPKGAGERLAFWNQTWNNWRWRTLLRIFFSRFLMARMGRDPEFFRYVEGAISAQIQQRAQHALTVLSPASNPFLQYTPLPSSRKSCSESGSGPPSCLRRTTHSSTGTCRSIGWFEWRSGSCR